MIYSRLLRAMTPLQMCSGLGRLCGVGLCVLVGLAGCDSKWDCTSMDQVMVDIDTGGLQCGDIEPVSQYISLLSARDLDQKDRRIVVKECAHRFKQDPEETKQWLEQVKEAGSTLGRLTGQEASQSRSRIIYQEAKGRGVLGGKRTALLELFTRKVSVWSKDSQDELALTEMDIEGWVNLASLCRQVQGAGSLRISVADRVVVYQILRDRFDSGTRKDRLALSSIGAFWPSIFDTWEAASYETQQTWIGRAALPPPMTATSLGYLEALIEGNVVQTADAVHDVLGPLQLRKADYWTSDTLDTP